MKTGGYITIEEISTDELADFLEIGMGCRQFGVDYDDNDYLDAVAKGVCCDEKYTSNICAKILLSGGKIKIVDLDCEGDSYGELDRYINEDEEVEYYVTLETIKSGLERALNGTYKVSSPDEKANVMRSARYIVEGDDYDCYDVYLVFQTILFNEIIYG